MKYLLRNCPCPTSITLCIAAILSVLAPPPARATDTQVKGAVLAGGQPFRAECPRGSFLIGFAGRAGNWIDQIAPVCAPLSQDRKNFGPPSVGKTIGSSTGGSPQQTNCPAGAAVLYSHFWMIVGNDGQQKFIEGIAGNCHTTTGAQSGLIQFGHYDSSFSEAIGLKSRPQHVSQCPTNEWATGFHGRAGQFINALGMICGPLITLSPGSLPSSQAGNISSAKPTAPTINLPQGFIVKGKGIFKITPSPYMTGTHAHIQLTWLNAPPKLQSFYQYEAPMSLIASPNGVDAPDTYLGPGTWRMVVRVSQPKVSDWSQPVQFQYYLQNPVIESKPLQAAPKLSLPARPPQASSGTQVNVSGCIANFVSRLAGPNDLVCVTPESHQRVLQENATAASRVNPQGAYGPNTCSAGYVWREAFPGDVVCVTPQVRALVRQENDLAANRTQ